jgi:hypothetical protein
MRAAIDPVMQRKQPDLYWDDDGRTACAMHAPSGGSAAWRLGQWQRMTVEEFMQLERETGRRPACETCAALLRPAVAS